MGRQERILSRFEIKPVVASDGSESPDEKTDNIFNDAVHQDYKGMVHDHFKGKSHKIKSWVVYLNVFMALCQMVSLILFWKGIPNAVYVAATLAWLVAVNNFHDGTHFAVSKKPWVNRLCSYCAVFSYTGPSQWNIQHVIQHHIHTNDEYDSDLFHFMPTVRLSRHTNWAPVMKFQRIWMILIVPGAAMHHMFKQPLGLLSGDNSLDECENKNDFTARNYVSLLGEVMSGILFFLVCVYSVGYSQTLVYYGMFSCFYLAFTQGTHLQSVCQTRSSSWAKCQAETSVNFACDSMLWWYLSGGLNLQSIHHVGPEIHSSHYIDLYPKFKALCKKHGVEFHEVDSIWALLGGWFNWLKELSVQETEASAPLLLNGS